MPELIQKRDGSYQSWDPSKITNAIKKAFVATNKADIADREAIRLTDLVLTNINGAKSISQERVQDLVELVLVNSDVEVARKFMGYREKRREMREANDLYLNIEDTISGYIRETDWRVNENANAGKSFPGLTLGINGAVQSRYWLNKLPQEIRDDHKEGFFHIHDLSFALCGYCSGWSLYDLLLDGFNNEEHCSSGPPKHFDTLLSQVVNFIGTLQNEWSGAQAFSSFDTLAAPFIYYDRLRFEEKLGHEVSDEFYYDIVKQQMQKFVFNMNTTSRWGGQCPFSNLTFDLIPPKHYADEPVVIGGRTMDKTYKEFDKERMWINKAFLEITSEGDYNKRIFSFPIPTYNITKDFPWESEVGTLLLQLTSKFGAPYFQNFINSDLDPADVRSMCCRLQLDKEAIREHLAKLTNKGNGLFGAGELTGSVGVVTLNLPKIAYIAKKLADSFNSEDKDKLYRMQFFALLDHYADLAKTSLEIKRKMLKRNLDNGMYPWTKRYLKHGFDSHFSTIGVVGGHEACLNLLGVGIDSDKGQEFAVETLNYLRERLTAFQLETGNLYNLEATPAEGTAYKLARLDKKNHSDIIASGSDEPYYTNSTQLPVDYTPNVFKALEHQNKLQTLYTGGTVMHIYLGESIPDITALKELIVRSLTLTKLPYVSITPTFSICSEHGYITGEHFTCPTCKKDTEVYSRVVGYYRPVNRYNKGKKCEFRDRQYFRFLN